MELKDLLQAVPGTGRVEAILVRPSRDADAEFRETVEVLEGLGLSGDRRARGTPNPEGKRHVTLVQAEHLEVVRSLLGTDVSPLQMRRNLVVSGLNLLALRDREFTVGPVTLEGTGHCHPCSQMEQRLGTGGYQAMRGHGGITARVVRGGRIAVGDAVIARTEDSLLGGNGR